MKLHLRGDSDPDPDLQIGRACTEELKSRLRPTLPHYDADCNPDSNPGVCVITTHHVYHSLRSPGYVGSVPTSLHVFPV